MVRCEVASYRADGRRSIVRFWTSETVVDAGLMWLSVVLEGMRRMRCSRHQLYWKLDAWFVVYSCALCTV